jgi:hypothetical protein
MTVISNWIVLNVGLQQKSIVGDEKRFKETVFIVIAIELLGIEFSELPLPIELPIYINTSTAFVLIRNACNISKIISVGTYLDKFI